MYCEFYLKKLLSQSCGIISTTQNFVPKGASKYMYLYVYIVNERIKPVKVWNVLKCVL